MDDLFLKRIEALAAAGHARDLEFDGVVARVAVDRFNAMPSPDDEAKERFTSLMTGALVRTDPASAARIAALLAPNPHAPEPVLAALAAKGSEAAQAVIEHAPGLSQTYLLSRADRAEVVEAAAIARRSEIGAAVIVALSRRPEAGVLRTLAENAEARFDRGALIALVQRGRRDHALARALLRRGDLSPAQEMSLFLSADAAMRRRLILEAERAALATSAPQMAPADLGRAVARAADGVLDRREIAASVARCLRVGRMEADSLLDDGSGEALAILLAASGVAPALASRALTALRPDLADPAAVGRDNIELARRMSRAGAWRIVTSIVKGAGPQQAPGEYQPRNIVAATPAHSAQEKGQDKPSTALTG